MDLCGVFTFGLFILLLCCSPRLFSHRTFTPPARIPIRFCVHHRSRSSRQSDLRGWASLLQGYVLDYVSSTMLKVFGLLLHKTVRKKKTDNQLTWPEGLCVSNSNEAGVVNFGLWGEIKKKLHEHVRSPAFAGWNLLHPFPFLHIEICKHRAQVEKYQNPLLTNTSVHHKIPAKLMTLPPASALLCVTMLISKCWHA